MTAVLNSFGGWFYKDDAGFFEESRKKTGFLTGSDFGDWPLLADQSPLFISKHNFRIRLKHHALLGQIAYQLLYNTCF
jgi:hypothetical protein